MSTEYGLDKAFAVIQPHIFEDRGPYRSINRLFRRQFRRANLTRHGRIRYLAMRAKLPYLTQENTKTEAVRFDMDYLISTETRPVRDDRNPPYRYDTPVVVIRHAGNDYLIDGGRRMRFLHFKKKRKKIDVLLITVDGSQGKLASFIKHLGDRVGQNFPGPLKR